MVYSRSTEYTDRAMTRSVKLSEDLVDFLKEHAEKEKEVPGCKAECIEICKSNAMRDLNDLRMLSRRCWLGEYFPAKVALRFENALESPRYIQRFNELEKKSWMDKKDTKPPWVNTYFPFSTTIESMESACATYGILSALLLTMNVSTFCSMQIDEWSAFESGVAMERCNGTSDISLPLVVWTTWRNRRRVRSGSFCRVREMVRCVQLRGVPLPYVDALALQLALHRIWRPWCGPH